MTNPLHTPGTEFAVGLMNPNPTSAKTKDGPVYRVSFEVEREVWDWFMEAETKGMILAAGAHVVADVPAEPVKAHGPYSDYARTLHATGLFRSPDVWRALGTDEQYQEWTRGRRCVKCGDGDYVDGERRNEYAHVTAADIPPSREGRHPNKPAFSGVPMCHADHARQHSQGWSAVGGLEAMRKFAMTNVGTWAHARLVEQFGVESLTEVSPTQMSAWAMKHGLERYLPR